ncbi:MAG: hypothetical protein FWG68_09550 [Defluviitaleaceae bacterium]|nr:hypothetical protein [Defluviitaleaceae bacterium]
MKLYLIFFAGMLFALAIITMLGLTEQATWIIAATMLSTFVIYYGFFDKEKSISLLIFLVKNRKPLQQANELAQILDNENDPDRFLAELSDFLEQHPQIKTKLSKETNSGKATALLNLGQFEQAVQIWENLLPEVAGKSTFIMLEYNTNYSLTVAYLEHGNINIEKAQQYYENLQTLIARKSTPRHLKSSMEESLAVLQARFAFENGDIQPMQAIYEKLLQDKCTARETADFNFRLAMVYEKLGNTAQQRYYLHEVIRNGNKLYFAKIAQEKLDELDCA